ncbi:hypothetical protein BC835DRAFT_1310531 [Cytidiella melzeri]|nr:hypothetical protein BC835DRAFT_1310531 [Cytidiella melzeri]
MKASNASSSILSPILGSIVGDGYTWGTNWLGQVDERSLPLSNQELTVPLPNISSRTQSTAFSGNDNTFKSSHTLNDGLFAVGDSWTSMITTPSMLMRVKDRNTQQNFNASASKLNKWNGANSIPGITDLPNELIQPLARVSSSLNGLNGLRMNTDATSLQGSARNGRSYVSRFPDFTFSNPTRDGKSEELEDGHLTRMDVITMDEAALEATGVQEKDAQKFRAGVRLKMYIDPPAGTPALSYSLELAGMITAHPLRLRTA